MRKITVPTKYENQSRLRIIQLIQEECGGSQQRFADRTGINKSSISQYVNGRNLPSSIRADQIAGAFKVNPAWVMGFDVPMIPSPAASAGLKDGALLAKIGRLTDSHRAVVENMVDSLLDLQSSQ